MGSRKSKHICSKTELTSTEIAEICCKTNLTDSEVHRRHLAFLEQYPTGLITREQFYESLDEVWPESHIDKFASHLFTILDQDRNGAIDFIEYINLTHKLDSNNINPQNHDETIFFELLFDMFDRNHNGYLEKRELKPLIESIYDLAGLSTHERRGLNSTHAQVKYLLNKLDKNGDKRLSKEEFLSEENWSNDERLGRFFATYYDVNN
ncbi:unnamed protein product [Adineta steineri]|uniref:EF-hand domain-containing protein n=2 Tax=Adineta steineri TaxID=433720 RepID=A0A813R4V2_9BILA|nr:unnamed protein product [Adineta steineri]CAF0799713.1 unnamed protein product [Adineta steineri]CAF3777068.1 unnamed protein product [Adineta steineri]